MQEAYLAPLPDPAQIFKGNLSEWLATQNSLTIDNIIHTYYNTGLDVVPQNSQVRAVRRPATSGLPQQIDIKAVSLTMLSETHMLLNGDSVTYKYPLPAAIWGGDYVIMPGGLMRELPSEIIPPNAVGISGINYAYGRLPERHYDILSTAVLSQLDLKGRSVVEFGAGYGHKLLLAAAHGAVAAIGLELPAVFRRGRAVLRSDLQFNLPALHDLQQRIKLVDRNILSNQNHKRDAMLKLWRNKVSPTYPLPTVAIASLGPSYDSDLNASENPHIRALELALSLPSVETIVAGGYAREYMIAGKILSDHYAESDALAREILHEYFEEVTTYELYPKGLQTLVATKRKS